MGETHNNSDSSQIENGVEMEDSKQNRFNYDSTDSREENGNGSKSINGENKEEKVTVSKKRRPRKKIRVELIKDNGSNGDQQLNDEQADDSGSNGSEPNGTAFNGTDENLSEKNEKNRIKGCMSQVWLLASWEENGPERRLHLKAASDSSIVRGLAALLLVLYDGVPEAQLSNSSARDIFEELGLSEHLSPSRRNGLAALEKRVRDFIASGS